MIKLIALALLSLNALTVFGQKGAYDIVIRNASVFDSRKGTVSLNRTICIKDGIITKETGRQKHYDGAKIINAEGKLLTPGFIDTHIHATDVFRTYGPLPEYFPKDSLEEYRNRISETYLPYGVTTAMIMGQPETWLSPILSWGADQRKSSLDIYTVGGALVSDGGRKPYINHVVVNAPHAARQKVIEYFNLGIRHIKLYWKLRRPEFEAAFHTADSLGMNVYGHVDQNVMFIDSALDIGLVNYEHILTLVNSVFHAQKDDKDFRLELQKHYAPGAVKNGQLERLEMFRFMHDKNPAVLNSLIDNLSKNKATFSTSIHLMAEPFGWTYFTANVDTSLSLLQLERCKENFRLFMGYVKQLFDKGIKLRIGTDWPNGGKAIVSEQLLLAEYGFSVPDILQISTINGATALGLDKQYGSIEKGKRANLLIWDKSPFDNEKNFLSEKTIIKDGIVLDKSSKLPY